MKRTERGQFHIRHSIREDRNHPRSQSVYPIIVASTMVALLEQSLPETTETTSAWATLHINQSVNGIPENCIILGMNASIPWDNPRNLISWETELLVDRLKSAIFIPILYIVGAPANVINMAVFFRQGLSKRINMCLFSLALLDLISLTVVFSLYAERIYTQFTDGEKYGPAYRYIITNNVIGLVGFLNGSVLLSAIISTERCICVLFPLRSQRCIPTKMLTAIIVVSVLVLVSLRFVVTAQYQVTCFYEMRTERKSWQVYVTDYYFRNKAMLEILGGMFYGFFISVGIPFIVLITTIITAIRLQQAVKWRTQTSSQVSNAKEIAVTKMLIALSIEFFVLSIPIIVFRLLPVFLPQLSPSGLYSNTFSVLLRASELCFCISASVNFFVYYFTSANYRETLYGLFGRKASTKIVQSKALCVTTSASTLTVGETDTNVEQKGVENGQRVEVS